MEVHGLIAGVGAAHDQPRPPPVEMPFVAPELAAMEDLEQGALVEVGAPQLPQPRREDGRAVGRTPAEFRMGGALAADILRRHDRLDAETSIQLRHLRRLPPAERRITHRQRSAQFAADLPPDEQIAHHAFPGDRPWVGQREPRPDEQPAGGHQPRNSRAVLRRHLEVIGDHHRLAVERVIAEVLAPLHQLQQLLEKLNQLQPRGPDRPSPLAVPVGMRNDMSDGLACVFGHNPCLPLRVRADWPCGGASRAGSPGAAAHSLRTALRASTRTL
ncbi:MAG: hypothetical protein BWZ08_02814 [candidate division BRC1 bacterium ADurb.BinA292]|nr:MAG: hypothetical protein BWZ08_02814 [candidate division BRC1 bacterium ADurb.BinA292]